jgi:hypothetical protein
MGNWIFQIYQHISDLFYVIENDNGNNTPNENEIKILKTLKIIYIILKCEDYQFFENNLPLLEKFIFYLQNLISKSFILDGLSVYFHYFKDIIRMIKNLTANKLTLDSVNCCNNENSFQYVFQKKN